MVRHRNIAIGAMLASLVFAANAKADGIVAKIVNSPLSAAGLVQGAHVGINIYLQSDAAKGIEFMDPNVVGYGVAAGGRVEIELADGFERDANVTLTQKTIMVVTGAPQQGMPGKAVGYKVGQGANAKTTTITPTKEAGLPAKGLMSPAKGAKNDPVRQRGIKVFHVGLVQSAFINRGKSGTIHVRFIDGAGKTLHAGSATVDFIAAPVAQIQPTNFPDKQRNHNWQSLKSGMVAGKSAGTVPIPIMLFARAPDATPAKMDKFKGGIVGAGVLSTQQLAAMKFERPVALARYNGGLIVRDANGDGRLNPKVDQIIGGVIGKAPTGAKGQELRSLNLHGAVDLSRPTSAYHAKFGRIFGGAIALLQFTAGSKPGLYRPTLALLSDPTNPASPDGSSYTYTIVVK
jgi:hypothetical protein